MIDKSSKNNMEQAKMNQFFLKYLLTDFYLFFANFFSEFYESLSKRRCVQLSILAYRFIKCSGFVKFLHTLHNLRVNQ